MSVIKYYLRYWYASKGSVLPWRPAISPAARGKISSEFQWQNMALIFISIFDQYVFCVVVNRYNVTTNPSKIALSFVHLNNHLTLETVKSWKRQSIYLSLQSMKRGGSLLQWLYNCFFAFYCPLLLYVRITLLAISKTRHRYK